MGTSELLIVVVLITATGGQLLPENTCPTYFQYVNDAFGGVVGEVTLPGLAQGRNRIDVRFTQRGDQDASAVGPLSPYPDERAARARPSRFRISLRPNLSTGILPKLSRLSYNDQLLCSASEYGPPNSFFNRFYELHISGSPVPLPSPSFTPFPQNPFDVDVQTIFFGPGSQGNEVFPGFTQSWRTSVVSNRPDALPSALPTSPAIRPSSLPASWPMFSVPGPPPTRSIPQVPTTRTETPPAPPPRTPAPPVKTAPPPDSAPRISPTPPTAAASEVCGQEGRWSSFIYNGQEYSRGKYPWLTAIHHAQSGKRSFVCGGSLLSTNMVITAAHCVHKMETHNIFIELGRHDLYDNDEIGAEARNVKGLLLHPDYNSRTQPDADVALVTMERPVVFNDIISPICLWTVEESSIVATSGFIAGWGKDEVGNEKTQYPRVVEAAFGSATDCASRWRVPRVTDRTLCAGNRDGSGPCFGDSGGGLMVRRHNRWLLRAIVSVGERERDRCQLNQFVLYCDLAKHLAWINDNLL
ncbi:uncharacterized protein Dana_GF18777 [Drosophila ananassae]|uniref:Peptidase S1 domain-containing protein n=1 Tax=Drosophila ananassae TaxID=7217 RepID=B3LYB3_DROAN|nr:proclotting enzyme [Drosophila ananassae]EDV44017.1 uncharacterized protein Dana_GF18777 [Drosophila ananassae]